MLLTWLTSRLLALAALWCQAGGLCPEEQAASFLGKCMRAGETTSDCFLGTFHLARPELSKGGQMFKPVKMTFFSRVRFCYITLSWNASSERQTPTEPRFSPDTALPPRTPRPGPHVQRAASLLAPQHESVPPPLETAFRKTIGTFSLNSLGHFFPLTLILFYFPVLPYLL